MNEHRYTLEPYKGMNSRYRCPSCMKYERTFTRYIDTETNEYLHGNVGRCSRESCCAYHYTPKQYFTDNKTGIEIMDRCARSRTREASFVQPIKVVNYIDNKNFKESLEGYGDNCFVQFLINLFGVEITNELISKYFIGTSKHWNGATVFWQIDTKGIIRTGKIMLYDAIRGKRIKKPFNHITWVHSVLKLPDFGLNQCLFGEHLLQDKTKAVAIVESEKTAIIASVYFPQFIWLAIGGLSNLKLDKCEILEGRSVVLFPDLKGFDKWSEKANQLSSITNFIVSDLLESKASELDKQQGYDLADYLTMFNYEDFTTPKIIPDKIGQVSNIEIPQKASSVSKPSSTKINIDWTDEITQLELYFNSYQLTDKQIELNTYTTITDVGLFIENHLKVIKQNNGNRTFIPYLKRLQSLKCITLKS